MGAENQRATSPADIDARRRPRFKFEVDISIHSRTCGMLRGHTVDLSESGVAAMLRLEVPLGEVVKLDFPIPFGPVTIYAMVRQRNAFRYGFQFLESNAVNEVIRPTCHQLAIEQSPKSNERGLGMHDHTRVEISKVSLPSAKDSLKGRVTRYRQIRIGVTTK